MTEFESMQLTNPVIGAVMRRGGTAEDCAVELAVMNTRLIARVMHLENIAPRKFRCGDGRVLLWRCPDELVPEIDMAGVPVSASPPDDEN